MPEPLARQVATRAVEAWTRRLLPSPEASHRPDGQISSFDKEVAQLREQTFEALAERLVGTDIDEDSCKNPDRARKGLAERFSEDSGLLAERLRVLERTVGQNAPLWRRYRPLISAVRDLIDPESDACASLLHEICFVLTLSGDRSLPWARRT